MSLETMEGEAEGEQDSKQESDGEAEKVAAKLEGVKSETDMIRRQVSDHEERHEAVEERLSTVEQKQTALGVAFIQLLDEMDADTEEWREWLGSLGFDESKLSE